MGRSWLERRYPRRRSCVCNDVEGFVAQSQLAVDVALRRGVPGSDVVRTGGTAGKGMDDEGIKMGAND